MAIVANPAPTRAQLIAKMSGVPKRMPTKYYNKKGRQFFLTLKGKYVLRQNGKTIYGRKSTDPSAPKAIRPVKKSVIRTPNSHPLMAMGKANKVRRVKASSSSLRK